MPPEQRAAADALEQAMSAHMKGYYAAIEEARPRLAALGPFAPALDLQKSWHILHYVFTGPAGDERAPGNALLAGDELGEDVGYGFIDAVELDQLGERVNYAQMSAMGIYGLPGGGGTVSQWENELRDEVARHVPRLKTYVAERVANGEGLLTWLS